MKAGIISQARMTSTRLPGKVLMQLGDKTVLEHHVDRLSKSGFPVIIATTTNATDDPVCDFCKERGIPFFRGDEMNVLDRFYGCASQFDLEVIARVTSDCPLIDGKLLGDAIRAYIDAGEMNTYMSNVLERTYPRGLDFEIFSFEMLKEARENARTTAEKEHVTPYFYAEDRPTIHLRGLHREEDRSHYRITLDMQEDLDLLRTMIEKHEAEKLDAEGLIALLDAHPELVEINAHIQQKKS